jgi:hypothetical protein
MALVLPKSVLTDVGLDELPSMAAMRVEGNVNGCLAVPDTSTACGIR